MRTLQQLLRRSFSATTYTVTVFCYCKHDAHLRTAAVLLPQPTRRYCSTCFASTSISLTCAQQGCCCHKSLGATVLR
jgi:hypothetical protein